MKVLYTEPGCDTCPIHGLLKIRFSLLMKELLRSWMGDVPNMGEINQPQSLRVLQKTMKVSFCADQLFGSSILNDEM